MSKSHYIIPRMATVLMLMLTLAACNKEKENRALSFSANMEQVDAGTKVRFVDERYVYWEYDDAITIASDQSESGDNQMDGHLINYGGDDFSDYNGVFLTYLPVGSKYFLGLHPASENNVINPTGGANFSASIYLRPTQPYRDDYSFAKQVLPMVAWYGGEWGDAPNTPFNLDFHSLAGIVRLQFYNSTSTDHTIKSITVTSSDKQLCGMFNINNIKTFNPSLTPTADANPTYGTLTLTMPGNALEFKKDSLRSFYLVLPSRSGSDEADVYSLSVRVIVDGGSGEFTLSLPSIKIRRNGITYTRAIGITSFAPLNLTQGIVGNGTPERPFKIYSLAELKIVRDSFANPRTDGYVYINGQRVTRETEFRIMRSDITLPMGNWTSGIPNFTGHMLYNSNAAVALHGITNSSNAPLFESIGPDGVVEGLTVKCNHSVNNNATSFSLFCNENNGKIVDCHITTPYTEDPGSHLRFYGTAFAGICCTNNGRIEGSTCSVLSRIAGNFAGICHTNASTGTIRGCIASSPMNVYNATNAAGICYQNNGMVEDCYYDAHYTAGTGTWGGICYSNNSTGTIRHCYNSNGGIIHGATVGGIAVNNSGRIEYCWSNSDLRGTTVGGIAATQSGTSSLITNCFIDDNLFVMTLFASASAHYAGGLVALLNGGSIKDSYTLINQIATRDNTGTYGSLVGRISSGTTIDNCYSYIHASVEANPAFYGENNSGTLTRCYLVGSTQTGVTHVDNDNASLGNPGLLKDLQDHCTSNHDWVSGSTVNSKTYPALEAYTITP